MSPPVLPLTDIVLRLGLATLLGALVGLERERLDRAAGMRTHTIVSLGAALIIIVSTYGFAAVLGPGQLVDFDPSRVAAQVVSGIGFLGAGVMIFRRNAVRGLTTAASVWTVAGLGLACGSGLFAAAGVATGILLLLQIVLRPLELRFFAQLRGHRLELRVRRGVGSLAAIEEAVARAGVILQSAHVQPIRDGTEDRVELDLGPLPNAKASALLETLRELEGTRLVSYTMGVAHPRAGTGVIPRAEGGQHVAALGNDAAEGDEERY